MSQNGTKRLTAILAVVMIIAIGGGTLAQLFTNPNQVIQPTVPVPTDAPIPTFAPPPDLSTISFSESYLHPSGLFSIAQPTGWTPASPVSNPDGVEVTMNNPEVLSVIQNSLQFSSEPITSLDQLDALYTTGTLNPSWSNYRRIPETGLNYRETDRRREGERLVIDFELQNQRQQTFLARQVAWSDGDWVYSVRVVTPANAIDLLKHLIDSIIPTFKANKAFAGTPGDWSSYFDPSNNMIIRFPSTWRVTDSAPGRPTTVTGEGVTLRLETQSGVSVADEDAAGAWVESSRSGAAVTSVEPVTRGSLSGFSVAYTYTDNDGAPNSGLAVLLNGDDALHIANLRLLNVADVDLNADDAADGPYSDALKALNTFQVLEGVTIVQPTPTPSPTPTLAPTAEATIEATAESTAEATEEATAEVTAEATEAS
jgi:hypothetical protein